MSDQISDDCFYNTCGECEEPTCRCHCHFDQEFSQLYGWQDLDTDWSEE